MNRSIVVGKFYPFHAGHAYLIGTALKGSDQVTVLVVDHSTQVLPGEERAAWIREMFPQAKVRVIRDIERDNDSKAWAEYTLALLGYRPDKVFTSEDYGTAYAKFLGAEHILVDKQRVAVPISGTKIRKNPYAAWEHMSAPVRARLARRVALVGAESTGTTTLTRALAKQFRTTWVPEFGRFYTEGKMLSETKWETEEFAFIADIQNRMEDAYARQADRILFCDTTAWATRLWHERYMGRLDPAVDALAHNRRYDLVILTGDEIPFVDDGMRDGEHIRHAMQGRFRELLESECIPYIEVRGSVEERLAQAVVACEGLLRSGDDIFGGFPRQASV
jgi:NadR type nicotinamide-nucleotide adenylyltransferase